MIGIVGKIKISYCMSMEEYEESYDPKTTNEFCLSQCNKVRFRVEEITYIEDTIYGVVLSMLEPYFMEDEFIIDDRVAEFKINEYGISGKISLSY
ncbi:MAG: hypothetical protein NC489_26630 [Ruminococcus flavefaciens]|nr:hypothetical protein [Ruminococcus flavefaciens]